MMTDIKQFYAGPAPSGWEVLPAHDCRYEKAPPVNSRARRSPNRWESPFITTIDIWLFLSVLSAYSSFPAIQTVFDGQDILLEFKPIGWWTAKDKSAKKSGHNPEII